MDLGHSSKPPSASEGEDSPRNRKARCVRNSHASQDSAEKPISRSNSYFRSNSRSSSPSHHHRILIGTPSLRRRMTHVHMPHFHLPIFHSDPEKDAKPIKGVHWGAAMRMAGGLGHKMKVRASAYHRTAALVARTADVRFSPVFRYLLGRPFPPFLPGARGLSEDSEEAGARGGLRGLLSRRDQEAQRSEEDGLCNGRCGECQLGDLRGDREEV
eukprot:scaffold254083_cov32-Tisochrysis_lutea.AAC.3